MSLCSLVFLNVCMYEWDRGGSSNANSSNKNSDYFLFYSTMEFGEQPKNALNTRINRYLLLHRVTKENGDDGNENPLKSKLLNTENIRLSQNIETLMTYPLSYEWQKTKRIKLKTETEKQTLKHKRKQTSNHIIIITVAAAATMS